MNRKMIGVALATVAMTAAWWWAGPKLMHVAAEAIVKSRELTANRKAPDFKLKNADGQDVKLSDFRGKVVLLNFWATWCGPCQFEIPWFVDFENKYGSSGFTVLGVSMDDDGWKVVKPFLAEKKVNYPVLLGDEKMNQAYGGIDSLPTTLMLDQDGRIAFIHAGLISKKIYQQEIDELLAKKPENARL
jgi:cytochrome c biogenesis protein CcmG/thiol:disulfide interchange protein DsbE